MLAEHGVEHHLLDANLEGLLYLLKQSHTNTSISNLSFPLVGNPSEERLRTSRSDKQCSPGRTDDVWTKRAFRNIEQNLSLMKDPALYHHIDRYKRAVKDISRVLEKNSPHDIKIGLSNYEDQKRSPLRSRDLLMATEKPELNPFYPYFRQRLEGLFKEKNPSVVGISLNYLSQALCSFSMTGFIKKEFPALKVIMGGGLVTSWLKNPQWKDPFSGLVDNFVAGQGEHQLLSLLGINTTKQRTVQPDYLSLPLDKYLSPGFILPYSASTGCYWNRCEFCPEKAEKNPYIPIPANQVISDLKALIAETDPVLIHLLDNAISSAVLETLCKENTGVPWYGFARISPQLADPDFCIALKKSGCVMLKLGIESGDQGVLDALQKGISVKQASVVLKNLKKAGIATYVYLIFGTPVETENEARKTLEFTVKHNKSIDFLNLAIFNMPICSETSEGIEKKGFYEGDLSLYTDFHHPHGWDRKHVRKFLENEFKKHPVISAIIKNDPLIFTSNHAPFFVKGR